MWRRHKNGRTYLDIAAGAAGNPSSPHAEGRAAHEVLEVARTTIARLVECKADDVLFTGGGTEANALAILGVSRTWLAEGRKPHLLYWPGSHASIVENMHMAEREGADIEALPIKDCRVDCDALASILRPETALVAIEAVDGETGMIWNTREVAYVLEKARSSIRFSSSLGPGPQSRRKPNAAASSASRAFLHVDASQAPWTEKLTRAHFGADLLTLDASKVTGARGIGCLIAPRTLALAPLYGGGGQERGLVPGSEAPELAKAFAEGLARAAGGRAEFVGEAQKMRAKLIGEIKAGVSDVLVNEASGGFVNPRMGTYETPERQVPNILNISLPGRDTDYLVALLDETGFAVSTKSACETAKPLHMERPPGSQGELRDSQEGSRAVFALFGDGKRAASTLRISWGPGIHEHNLTRFGQALIKAIHFVDTSGAT